MERAVRAHDDVAPAATPLAGELDRALVGLGARVAEEHLTDGLRPALAGDQRVDRGGDLGSDRRREEVRRVQQSRGLRGQRRRHRRVAVAERRDREPGQEVEVSLAGRRPKARCPRLGRTSPAPGHTWASTASSWRTADTPLLENHRADPFVGEHLEQQDVGDAPVQDVRAPDAVSHRMHAGARPSGSSRRSATPSAISASSSPGGDLADRACAGSLASRRIPSMSVRYTSFSAPSASATAPATTSALMLYACPSAPEPIVAMTGMRSCASNRSRIAGFTRATSPTKPSAGSCGLASMSPADSPLTPTASAPCTLIADTMPGLTFPTSTMRAMSTVSASVTRSPSRNSGTLPSRSIRSLICGPPPCTTTGRMPTARISTMSSANRLSAADSPRLGIGHPSERVAAVLHDDGLAPESADVGKRLDERRCLDAGGGRHGCSPTVGRPVVSGRPSTRLAHCTAPARRALHEVVDRGDDHDPARARIEARGEMHTVAAERRLRRGRTGRTTMNGSFAYAARKHREQRLGGRCGAGQRAGRSRSPGCPRFIGARCGVNSTDAPITCSISGVCR